MKEVPDSITHNPANMHRLKYMQLVDYIMTLIEDNKLKVNDRLPSVNQLTDTLKISKETALKGLNYLSEKGIIESVYRKGYYLKRLDHHLPYRICLILDKMNILRDRVYQSFIETIKDHASVEVFFHHHNFKVFERLIDENLNNFTHFVVVTFFCENPAKVLNKIPPHKRIVIDHFEKGLEGEYTSIYQDHRSDIKDALSELLPQLERYNRLLLVTPSDSYHARDLIEGFESFATQNNKQHEIIHRVEENQMKRGDVFITFDRYDKDDVDIIRFIRKKNWQLGKDIGLISYNDTAVKEVLENGITVISTDFHKMGRDAANAILNRKTITLRDPAKVIFRNSL